MTPETTPVPSSSDVALRHRAPSCVALRWRKASTWREDAGERLARRFDFVETAVRYLVATLAVEQEAQGLGAAPGWSTLKESLGGRPATLGLWCDAARDLSRSVLRQPAPLLAPLAEVLAERGGEPGSGWRALERLIPIRNAHAHRDGGRDAQALLRETDDPFRDFLTALRHIARLSPWVATSLEHRAGVFEVTALPLRGADPLPPRVVQAKIPIETRRPFVVTADGTLVYLTPLLRWGVFPGATAREAELRLMKDWKRGKGPRFSDPLGMEDAAPSEVVVEEAPAEWLARGVAGAIVPGAFLSHTNSAAVLHAPDRAERVPEVPGYRVGTRIGQGGNGRVYHARSVETGDPVAVKVLPAELVADEGGRGRLLREFELMRSLTHPNVTRVYEFLPETPSGPVLVMEYVAGLNLRARVADRTMGPDEAVGVLSQLLAGLGAAHRLGIVHRDITPENVVLGPSGEVKLLDFGIAVAPGSERLTRTIDGLGKVSFAAPEQIHRPREAGPPADVYACGKLLGFLVSGTADVQEGLQALPGALQAIVRRAVGEAPERRFADAGRMREALEEARRQGWEGAPVGAGDRLSPEYAVTGGARRARPGLWLVGVRREGEERVAVVAERRREAEEALVAALRALRPEDRERLGHPDLRETRDGLRWCLLRARSVAEVGPAFGGEAAPARSAPPPAPPAPEPVRSAPPPAPSTPVQVQEEAVVVRPTWAIDPPAPGEQSSNGLFWAVVAVAGVAFPPLLFALLVPLVQMNAWKRLPPVPRVPRPAYLPPLPTLTDARDLSLLVRALDLRAQVILVQRHVAGVEALEPQVARGLAMEPLHATWRVLRAPPAALGAPYLGHLPSPKARASALSVARSLYHVLANGGRDVPSVQRAHHALVLLDRLAHAGAAVVPSDRVEAELARGAA